MKILITGGDGFIAKNLVDQLGSKYVITALNSKELNLFSSSKVFDFIKGNQFDVVIHTATYDAAPKHSVKNPAKVLENNLKMFFNVARCKRYFKKMIYFGSGAEFSRKNWIPKMKEDYFDQYVPGDQYGLSKYIMTKYAQLSCNIYNLRLFGVFGKYDNWQTRFIPNACCYAVSNMPIKINQNRIFDFLYIDDLVKIVRWFIENNPSKNVYNVCSGITYDFISLAKKIIKISGKKLDVVIKKDGFGQEYSGDNSRLLQEIKDLKFSNIDKSLKELYYWYKANKNNFDKDKL